MITLLASQLREIFAQAREQAPRECCGLVGGHAKRGRSTYPLQNVASDPLVTYEAAPEDLFSAQRQMRDRGEQLIGIYHSHPRSAEPTPSLTDVRLAYYPAAIYLIIGLAGDEPVLRAFNISEKDQSWEPVEYEIVDE